MGRHPKPTFLKQLEGNPGKRALYGNEPKYTNDSVSPPDWLDDAALAEWDRLAPQLQRMRLLTDAEVALFANYCQSYADVGRLTREIREEGETSPDQNKQDRKNPKIMIRSMAMNTLADCIKQFGFSPVTRAKIIVEATGDKRESPFAKYTG